MSNPAGMVACSVGTYKFRDNDDRKARASFPIDATVSFDCSHYFSDNVFIGGRVNRDSISMPVSGRRFGQRGRVENLLFAR